MFALSLNVVILSVFLKETVGAPQIIEQIGQIQNGTFPGFNGNPMEGIRNQTGGYFPGLPSGGQLPNATLPGGGSQYIDAIQGQTGNINNQTAQIQGCIPANGIPTGIPTTATTQAPPATDSAPYKPGNGYNRRDIQILALQNHPLQMTQMQHEGNQNINY